jgi:hypothetical protein
VFVMIACLMLGMGLVMMVAIWPMNVLFLFVLVLLFVVFIVFTESGEDAVGECWCLECSCVVKECFAV